MQYPLHLLTQPLNHGNFTPSKVYPCLLVTKHGNGGLRGFYRDDLGDVRMVPTDAFTETDGLWRPPVPAVVLTPDERRDLAKRWAVTPLTISNWMTPNSASYHPIRFADAFRGSKMPECNEPLTGHELRVLVESHGFYIQEVAVRWNTQQFGDRIRRMATEQPALFWDLWRGMVDAGGGV